MLLAWETFRPARAAGPRWRRFGFHLSLTVLNSALYELFYGASVARTLGPAAGTWSIVAAVLYLDFCLYWLHRVNHAWPWLWRFHQVHHSDTQVDLSTAFREHPGQTLLSSLLMLLPLWWLRPSPLAYSAYTVAIATALYFQHANVALPAWVEKNLARLFVTPQGHVPHHFVSAGKSQNFGVIFNVWDKLFGTWTAASVPAPKFGVTGDTEAPLSVGTVLLRPFTSTLVPALTAMALVLGGCKWLPDDPKGVPDKISPETQAEIDYGRDLIVHTARYFGPQGTVAKTMNSRMNCQNCHLDAGTKPFGISFQTVHNRYPDYRAREGRVMSLESRINNCFERPMNGQPLPPQSREMVAILTYFRHLARGAPTGFRRKGDRLNDAVLLPKRLADVANGAKIYAAQCVRCHKPDGQGELNRAESEYIYPPLWGPESYNEASSMARIIKLAAFVKANMPLGATYDKPTLTDEEAFDVAAFINDDTQHPRPKTRWADYPDPKQRPIDERKGPYLDPFPEEQHRVGPFGPIIRYLIDNQLPAFY